jgi:pyruvate kinase
MVARGDLGVELSTEEVPTLQKRIIEMANGAGKVVITATQMLESMIENPRPTRAEASDVANAILDGTDAVMLSGETAVGSYPVEAVQYMDRIAREAETVAPPPLASGTVVPADPDTPVTMAVCALAEQVAARAIVVPTLSGRTARLVARCRPGCAIIAPVPSEAVRRRLALVWGVAPVTLSADLPPGADRLGAAVRAAFQAGAVRAGELVIVLAGHPVAGGERMPTVRIVRVGPEGASVQP